ncbi:MAG: regulatory iron-sulfur-containing complex subunit RicT [Candidatus Omnitrophota bacterium]
MAKLIQVKIGEFGPVSLCDLNNIDCNRDDCVIVQVDRSMEYGAVISNVQAEEHIDQESEGQVLRVATADDQTRIKENQQKAKEAIDVCLKSIDERKLDMQIVKSEYTFDASKVIFFFTSEGRVDFRALVKDLAKIFKVRIELRQIGVRDKAKIIGGFGICGLEQCCSSYMKGFHALSIKMAKEQNLPLNPSKIAGVCGRIKCCMAYEFSVYKEFAKNLPRPGEKITTLEGKGRVFDVNVLKRLVSVDIGEGKTIKMNFPRSDEN